MKNHGGDSVYVLGMIGAAVFYLQRATDINQGIIGLFKSVVWPAFLVHRLLGFLGM